MMMRKAIFLLFVLSTILAAGSSAAGDQSISTDAKSNGGHDTPAEYYSTSPPTRSDTTVTDNRGMINLQDDSALDDAAARFKKVVKKKIVKKVKKVTKVKKAKKPKKPKKVKVNRRRRRRRPARKVKKNIAKRIKKKTKKLHRRNKKSPKNKTAKKKGGKRRRIGKKRRPSFPPGKPYIPAPTPVPTKPVTTQPTTTSKYQVTQTTTKPPATTTTAEYVGGQNDIYPPECKCRELPDNDGTCYDMYTDKRIGYCKERSCTTSYECVPGGGDEFKDCIRRVAIFEVVPLRSYKGLSKCKRVRRKKPKVFYTLYY